MTRSRERRCKIAYVPYEFIASFLTFTERDCIVRPIVSGLPKEGCEVEQVQYFHDRNAFGFIV